MTTTAKGQYDGVTIYLRKLSAADLFEGLQDMTGIDVEASRERFYELLEQDIATEYPGADVQATSHDAYADRVEAPRSMAEAEERIYTDLFRPEGDLSTWLLPMAFDNIWQRQEFWIETDEAIA